MNKSHLIVVNRYLFSSLELQLILFLFLYDVHKLCIWRSISFLITWVLEYFSRCLVSKILCVTGSKIDLPRHLGRCGSTPIKTKLP